MNNNPLSYIDPSGFTPNSVSGTNMNQEQFMSQYQQAAAWFSQFCEEDSGSAECWNARQHFAIFEHWYQGMMAEEYARGLAVRTLVEFRERDSSPGYGTRVIKIPQPESYAQQSPDDVAPSTFWTTTESEALKKFRAAHPELSELEAEAWRNSYLREK